jgi:hypothetical protein
MTSSAVKVQASAALVALLLLGVLVARASSAAFVGATANDDNAFNLGQLDLTDDAASALFTVSNMLPGQKETRCITVTYTGVPNPGVVKVYTAGFSDPDSIAQYLDITIHQGTGDTTGGSCTGFAPADEPIRSTTTLASFRTSNGAYSTGVGTWNPPATGSAQGYQVEVQLKSSTPETAEGKALNAFNLTWEVQAGTAAG